MIKTKLDTKLDIKEPTLQDRIQEEEVEDYTPQVEITKSLLNGQEMRPNQMVLQYPGTLILEFDNGDIAAIDDIHEVSFGRYHVVVKQWDGTVYTIGDNTYGQLGIGSNEMSTEFNNVAQSCKCLGFNGTVD